MVLFAFIFKREKEADRKEEKQLYFCKLFSHFTTLRIARNPTSINCLEISQGEAFGFLIGAHQSDNESFDFANNSHFSLYFAAFSDKENQEHNKNLRRFPYCISQHNKDVGQRAYSIGRGNKENDEKVGTCLSISARENVKEKDG